MVIFPKIKRNFSQVYTPKKWENFPIFLLKILTIFFPKIPTVHQSSKNKNKKLFFVLFFFCNHFS